ncbi:flagellar assembly protein FliW [Paenibacillus sp. V4I5]|uniref:flagellar assembly protein FliW n=1 Tax=Paenibacillus sp. V4I5 TaxID=3042306 RepID=UPI00278DADFA|nr:flagellar assembly protein FliW [Paenibacillus sp. V4I5]MDQ0918579.1 flagellar assembly factor FliW [Paenibacillus sp. V4I5]
MLLDTIALGQINYEEEEVITFAQGIPGFETFQRYLVIESIEEEPIAYLQSIDEGRLHFVIINPFYVHMEYEFRIEEADQIELGIKSESDVEVWSILTTSEHIQETTINLLAPIIINRKCNQAKQIILNHTAYRTKHRLSDLIVASNKNEGE